MASRRSLERRLNACAQKIAHALAEELATSFRLDVEPGKCIDHDADLPNTRFCFDEQTVDVARPGDDYLGPRYEPVMRGHTPSLRKIEMTQSSAAAPDSNARSG